MMDQEQGHPPFLAGDGHCASPSSCIPKLNLSANMLFPGRMLKKVKCV